MKQKTKVRILLTIAMVIIVFVFFMLYLRFPSEVGAHFEYELDGEGNAVLLGYYSGELETKKDTLELPDSIEDSAGERHKVTAIAENAFGGHLWQVKKVIIPEGVEEIGEGAFSDAPLLTEVRLPDTLIVIGARAFARCEKLRGPNLPEGLTTIGDEAFYNCLSLDTIKIPASVSVIGHDAFASCGDLLMDVSENALAAEIAAAYHIETGSGLHDTALRILVALLVSALLFALVLLAASRIAKARGKKKADALVLPGSERLSSPPDDSGRLSSPPDDSGRLSSPSEGSGRLSSTPDDSGHLSSPSDDSERLSSPSDDSERLSSPPEGQEERADKGQR